ncbi:hypothetical protein HK100_003880 [Physocladia obscura]|uniref:DCUN1 domain-containing protein n=1 Tax=Physocladia obscura TaxID=109957 RepID=A0AAD5TAG4_9FUNG|nr:hypothetical protein HK100_003880 [Physocladia obscura]
MPPRKKTEVFASAAELVTFVDIKRTRSATKALAATAPTPNTPAATAQTTPTKSVVAIAATMPPKSKRQRKTSPSATTATKATARLLSTATAKKLLAPSAQFNALTCAAWFKSFQSVPAAGSDCDDDHLDIEGIELLCDQTGIDVRGPVALALSYRLSAQQMGVFSKAEWMNGMQLLNVDSTEKLKDKVSDLESIFRNPVEMKEMYKWAFHFGKESKDRKYIDIDITKGLWKLMLTDTSVYKHVDKMIEFLQDDEGTGSALKVVNKDQWMSFWDFSVNVQDDMCNYEESNAWPVILDDFVPWSVGQPSAINVDVNQTQTVKSAEYEVRILHSDNVTNITDDDNDIIGNNNNDNNKSPELSGGVFVPSAGDAVIWRICSFQRVLELRWASGNNINHYNYRNADTNQNHYNYSNNCSVVRFAFPRRLLPGGVRVVVDIDVNQTESLLVLAATAVGVASFKLPLDASQWPNLIPDFEIDILFSFGPDRHPRLAHFPDADTCTVATVEGAVLVVNLPRLGGDNQVSVSEMAEQKSFGLQSLQSLWQVAAAATPGKSLRKSLFGSAVSVPSSALSLNPCFQPVAMTSVAYEEGVYLLALCRDKKLRVFDVITHSHIKTLSVFGSSGVPGLPTSTPDSSSTVASNISILASGLNSLGLSSSVANFTDNNSAEVSFDSATVDHLLPSVDPNLTFCSHIKVFHNNFTAEKSYQFKVAVYIGPGSGVIASQDSQLAQFQTPASCFSIFEGELDGSGMWRQIHHLGIKTGPILKPSECLKDFTILPQKNSCINVKVTDDNSATKIAEQDFQWYTIWIAAYEPIPSVSTNTNNSAAIYWSEVEIGNVEDRFGKRVRRSGSANLAGRWFQVPESTNTAASASLAKSGFPHTLENLIKSLPLSNTNSGKDGVYVSSETLYADYIFKSCQFSAEIIERAVEIHLAKLSHVRGANFGDELFDEFQQMITTFSVKDHIVEANTSMGEMYLMKEFVAKIITKAAMLSTTEINRSFRVSSVGRNTIGGSLGTSSKNTVNVAEGRRLISKEWSEFLTTCRAVDVRRKTPLGLLTISDSNAKFTKKFSPKIMIIQRGGISIVRPVTPTELVQQIQYGVHNNNSDTSGVSTAPTLSQVFLLATIVSSRHFGCNTIADSTTRTQILNFVNLVQIVRKGGARNSSDGGSIAVVAAKFLDELAKVLQKPVHGSLVDAVFKPLAAAHLVVFRNRNRANSAGEEHGDSGNYEFDVELDGEESKGVDEEAFMKGVQGFEDFGGFLERIVDVFALKAVGAGGDSVGSDGDRIPGMSYFINSLIVETFAEVCAARRSLIENIVLVFAYLTLIASDEKGGVLASLSKKIAPKILGVYLGCVTASASSTAIVCVERKEKGIDMMDIENNGKRICTTPIPVLGFEGSSVSSRSLFLVEAADSILQGLGLFSVGSDLPSSPFSMLRVSSQMICTVAYLAKNGAAKVASQILDIYPKDTHCLQYLDSLVKVQCGEFASAGEGFEKAAAAFAGSLKVIEKDWHLLLQDSVIDDGLTGYYQHVMSLFEEANVHKVVAVFAKLALDSMLEKEKLEKNELCQALWKKMFKHSLEGKQFESAYMFLVSNSDVEVRKYSIRRFITALCENHEIGAMCMRYSFGKLQSEVEETLIFKAKTRNVVPIPTKHTAGAGCDPNYHQILYAYYTFRGDNRSAGAIMYDYARRLNLVASFDIGGKSLVDVITEQARAYLAAINALSLVKIDYQWILYEVSDVVANSLDPLRKRRKITSVSNEIEYGISGENSEKPKEKTKEIVDITEIRREYALALAKLTLAERYHEMSVCPNLPDPKDVVFLFSQEGRFDSALKLAKIFDFTLIEVVFGSFGARCVELAEIDKQNGSKTPYKSLIEDPPVEWEGSNSDKAWMALKLRLEEYIKDEEKTGRYRRNIVDKGLQKNSNAQFPTWLLNGFKKSKGEDLIRVYLKHGLTLKACWFAVEFVGDRLTAFHDHGDGITPSHSSKWLSFTTVDQLLIALETDIVAANQSEDEDTLVPLRDARTELTGILYAYLYKIQEDTVMFAGNAQLDKAPVPEQITAKLIYDGDNDRSAILAKLGPRLLPRTIESGQNVTSGIFGMLPSSLSGSSIKNASTIKASEVAGLNKKPTNTLFSATLPAGFGSNGSRIGSGSGSLFSAGTKGGVESSKPKNSAFGA